MRALARPWTRILIRSSGSLSILITIPTVPTGWMSCGVGFSTSSERWAASMMVRFPARAASIALTDISRPTKSEDHVGEDDDVPDREQREALRNLYLRRVFLSLLGHPCPRA